MCYNMRWWVVGTPLKCKKVAHAGNLAHTGQAGNIGGEDQCNELDPCNKCSECRFDSALGAKM